MKRFAGHLLGLTAAVALTAFATAALTIFGWNAKLPAGVMCMCIEIQTLAPHDPGPRPPVTLVRPKLRSLRPPTILCELPDDPMSVTYCDAPPGERSGTP